MAKIFKRHERSIKDTKKEIARLRRFLNRGSRLRFKCPGADIEVVSVRLERTIYFDKNGGLTKLYNGYVGTPIAETTHFLGDKNHVVYVGRGLDTNLDYYSQQNLRVFCLLDKNQNLEGV